MGFAFHKKKKKRRRTLQRGCVRRVDPGTAKPGPLFEFL
jgi:hypothetical protein